MPRKQPLSPPWGQVRFRCPFPGPTTPLEKVRAPVLGLDHVPYRERQRGVSRHAGEIRLLDLPGRRMTHPSRAATGAIPDAPLTRLPPGRSLQRGVHVMSNFDEGVILRAHRFRAELAGYRIERGHYMGGEEDRADRWYVVPVARTVSTAADRSGPGFRTLEAAADEAERLVDESRGPTSGHAVSGSRGRS